jgi:hypothetical protein
MMTSPISKGVICFTNPQQLPYVKQLGIYGNVSVGDIPKNPHNKQSVVRARITRFGKLKDLLCIAPGDYVFLFEKKESKLHGVWRVSDEPFYCSCRIFDPSDDYPYRFYMQPFLNFPNPVPITELRKLLDKNILWSIRTFEREIAAGFASINPISFSEVQALLDLFWKYNHKINPASNLISYNHPPLQNSINFHDMVMTDTTSSNISLRIEANDLGQHVRKPLDEEALHCFFIYNLVRGSRQMRELFGEYRQVLREVPVSVAGQKRADILLIYHNELTGVPSVYSIMEVKRGEVNVRMLSQLLEYIRLFSERHSLDLNSVEGIYVGESFQSNAIKYVKERAKIEVERRLRLIIYEIVGNKIKLNEIDTE